MKKWQLSLFVLLAAFAGQFRAEAAEEHSLALGFEGIGSEWGTGKPTLRWKRSDRISWDFTPTIQFRTESEPGSTDSYTAGLNVGRIKSWKVAEGLHLGIRNELGYTVSWSRAMTQANDRSTLTKNYHVDYGIGPDIEYFIPSFPQLSLGAQAIVHLLYGETRSGDMDQRKGFSSDIQAQIFTIRYYF